MLNFKNISYGQLVDYLPPRGGRICSVKVHFFNRKGVLVGREYKFVRYHEIQLHPLGKVWELQYLSHRCKWIRQKFYELVCRVVTLFIRFTQKRS